MEVKKVLSTNSVETIAEPNSAKKPENNTDNPILQNNEEFQPVKIQHNTTKQSSLREKILETKNKQGLFGMLWDGFKNLTGIGAGSDKALQAIEKFEKGQISEQETLEAVENYKEGQKQSVDIVADITSGIIAFAAFSVATGIGLAAAPFTAGASLGLVAIGIGIAGAAGSLSKAAIKKTDAMIGGDKYDSFGYDMATGFVNGIFAPITAGIGGAVGKTVAQRVGVTAVREGGEIVLAEGVKSTAKGAVTRTLLTTNVSYKGGTLLARAAALGSDMAANGAVTGAADSSVRYLAGDAKNKSLSGLLSEVATGTMGGLIAAPVIGGGMRLAGNSVGKLTGKIKDKVQTNYDIAKKASLNNPHIENPDAEVARGLFLVLKQIESLAENTNTQGKPILRNIEQNLTELSDTTGTTISKSLKINSELSTMSAKNRTQLKELLVEIAQNPNPNKIDLFMRKYLIQLEEAGGNLDVFSKEIDLKLKDISKQNTQLKSGIVEGIQVAEETLEAGTRIIKEGAEKAGEIPNTRLYQELGEFPERIKTMVNSTQQEITDLKSRICSANSKFANAQTKEAVEELQDIYKQAQVFERNLGERLNEVQSSPLKGSLDIIKERINTRKSMPGFEQLSKEAQKQAFVEDSNIAFAKFIQTYSSDQKLPPDIRTFFKEFTINATSSRNLSQAQEFTNQLYGSGNYTLKKAIGTGTIGEVYLAVDKNGNEVVIKMLKNGVNSEKFAQDKKMFLDFISEYITDSTDKKYKTTMINSMFDSWEKELDFALEAQAAKDLAKGAKRFKVAQTLEIGNHNGQNVSLVMEKADGVALDTLLEMIKFKKANPTDYLTKSLLSPEGKELNPWIKNVEYVKTHSALAESDAWIKALPKAYQRAQNEQSLFVSKTGKKTLHSDPHGGNIFVDVLPDGKLQITYIDTGNVVTRANKEVIHDIGLALNMTIGNSKGVAKTLLDGAIIPDGKSRADLEIKLAKLLDDKLFKAGVNIKNIDYTQTTIETILKELSIIPNPNNAALFKAGLQRIKTTKEIENITGINFSKRSDLKDLMVAILKSMKTNPKETMQTIIPVMKWAYKNNNQAMISFFQVLIKTHSSTETIAP